MVANPKEKVFRQDSTDLLSRAGSPKIWFEPSNRQISCSPVLGTAAFVFLAVLT
ncbi:unnamed protein product [Callosobruchus maculatus]|uniref:Uncharacterized protein n=1 Tax=Callosobruchus maculatus TaxID=64391 RepID=A0A653DNU4_CALMS|nr:unnamed protein product [Callosobruchus maculatus]VEN61239.1 unnamed protein product [Callosobruchus maculatus]VEN61649.1 unnamed protein product [Callosobruchus maculatus]VEN62982.1 unnamed protein product [Callosobruchus maculatus]VEN62985.1 unnamed protein product [Callosobruchus maculatus]